MQAPIAEIRPLPRLPTHDQAMIYVDCRPARMAATRQGGANQKATHSKQFGVEVPRTIQARVHLKMHPCDLQALYECGRVCAPLTSTENLREATRHPRCSHDPSIVPTEVFTYRAPKGDVGVGLCLGEASPDVPLDVLQKYWHGWSLRKGRGGLQSGHSMCNGCVALGFAAGPFHELVVRGPEIIIVHLLGMTNDQERTPNAQGLTKPDHPHAMYNV